MKTVVVLFSNVVGPMTSFLLLSEYLWTLVDVNLTFGQIETPMEVGRTSVLSSHYVTTRDGDSKLYKMCRFLLIMSPELLFVTNSQFDSLSLVSSPFVIFLL